MASLGNSNFLNALQYKMSIELSWLTNVFLTVKFSISTYDHGIISLQIYGLEVCIGEGNRRHPLWTTEWRCSLIVLHLCAFFMLKPKIFLSWILHRWCWFPFSSTVLVLRFSSYIINVSLVLSSWSRSLRPSLLSSNHIDYQETCSNIPNNLTSIKSLKIKTKNNLNIISFFHQYFLKIKSSRLQNDNNPNIK